MDISNEKDILYSDGRVVCSDGDIIRDRIRWYKNPIQVKVMLDGRDYFGALCGHSLCEYDGHYWVLLNPGQHFPTVEMEMRDSSFFTDEEKKFRRLLRWQSSGRSPFLEGFQEFIRVLLPLIERV